MDEPTQIAVFWLLYGFDNFRVLVRGEERTDFEKIVRVSDGARGILFNALTFDEMCHVSIKPVVVPRSQRERAAAAGVQSFS
jgi:hypothetical protein